MFDPPMDMSHLRPDDDDDIRAAEIRGATWALEAANSGAFYDPEGAITAALENARTATLIVDARRKEQAK
jgi:hypothetical protein